MYEFLMYFLKLAFGVLLAKHLIKIGIKVVIKKKLVKKIYNKITHKNNTDKKEVKIVKKREPIFTVNEIESIYRNTKQAAQQLKKDIEKFQQEDSLNIKKSNQEYNNFVKGKKSNQEYNNFVKDKSNTNIMRREAKENVKASVINKSNRDLLREKAEKELLDFINGTATNADFLRREAEKELYEFMNTGKTPDLSININGINKLKGKNTIEQFNSKQKVKTK